MRFEKEFVEKVNGYAYTVMYLFFINAIIFAWLRRLSSTNLGLVCFSHRFQSSLFNFMHFIVLAKN